MLKLTITRFSSASCHLLPVRHPVLMLFS
jgi:hypothetical protein